MAIEYVDATQLDSDLTSVADAIRAKSGGSSSLAFPSGFVSEIQAIPSGGGGEVSEKDVNFYDYDGTRLYSYTAEEFQALSELPPNPSHEGLTAQGWNYTKQQALTVLQSAGGCDIGQNYVTNDGKTRFYITVTEFTPTIYIKIPNTNGSATIDWGDGTQEALPQNTYKGHTYETIGDYVISIAGATALNGTNSYGNFTRIISRNKWWNDNQASPENNQVWRTVNKIEIGSNISSVPNAFAKLRRLEKVIFPNSISNIGTYTFQSCLRLLCAIIPNGVTSIEANSFISCVNLRHVSIPAGVTAINDNAFNTCTSLTNVVLPNEVITIGTSAFQNCYNLIKINIPENVTTIKASAFQNCYNLINIIIPNGTTTLGNSVFQSCSNLLNANIPNNITSVGTNLFNGCSSLTSINIPNGITTITGGMFQGCYGLASINIPESVTTIGSGAFQNCSSLTHITIPSKVTSIAANAFNRCRLVTEYHLLPETPPTLSATSAFTGIQSGCHIYVPYSEDHSILNAYKTATNWSTYANYIVEEEP